MYNKAKIKMVLLICLIGLIGFVGMIGYTLGNKLTHHQAVKQAEKSASRLLEEKAKSEADKLLSEDKVKDFLIHYFTKRKLGENNPRIKSLMTESAYNRELAEQEKAINQVNKEFIVDYIFEEATIFINEKTKEVIAETTYTVTYLSEMREGQQFKNTSRETVTTKLTYTESSGKLLVNQIVPWQIKLSNLADGGQAYLEKQGISGSESSTPVPSPDTVVETSE